MKLLTFSDIKEAIARKMKIQANKLKSISLFHKQIVLSPKQLIQDCQP